MSPVHKHIYLFRSMQLSVDTHLNARNTHLPNESLDRKWNNQLESGPVFLCGIHGIQQDKQIIPDTFSRNPQDCYTSQHGFQVPANKHTSKWSRM